MEQRPKTRRLKMMIAGSIAVWVPVASANETIPNLIDLNTAVRLKVQSVDTQAQTVDANAR